LAERKLLNASEKAEKYHVKPSSYTLACQPDY
jgi:hypothetical protein